MTVDAIKIPFQADVALKTTSFMESYEADVFVPPTLVKKGSF
jgi:hypothetical protein